MAAAGELVGFDDDGPARLCGEVAGIEYNVLLVFDKLQVDFQSL